MFPTAARASGQLLAHITLSQEGHRLATTAVPAAARRPANGRSRADSAARPVEHRTQFEIDGLQRAEGVLDGAETFCRRARWQPHRSVRPAGWSPTTSLAPVPQASGNSASTKER